MPAGLYCIQRQYCDTIIGRHMTLTSSHPAVARRKQSPLLPAASRMPPYPGILLNNLTSDQNASPYITAPSRNGAPGSSTGAPGEVK